MKLKLIEVARRKFTRVKIRTKDWDIDSINKALGDKPIKQSSHNFGQFGLDLCQYILGLFEELSD